MKVLNHDGSRHYGVGILPAVLSGKLCATAIVGGEPETYVRLLRTHPIIRDYTLLHALQSLVRKVLPNREGEQHQSPVLLDKLIVTVFALLFSGKRIPGSSLLASMRK